MQYFHKNTFLLPLLIVWTSCNGQNVSPGQSADDIAAEMVSQINTTTDPAFEYEYAQTKFVPPAGKSLLIMGQTVEDISDYLSAFSERPIPGGWSAYWGIPKFEGVTETSKNENGTSQNHQSLVDRFPNTVLNSGLWMVGKWGVAKNTANGTYDKVIKKYSKWAKSVDRPIYLRIGYEFDGPHNELEPGEYVRAYRRIVDQMRDQGVENVAFVWHSYIFEPYRGYDIEDYYPGDDYVDWVGVSMFGLLYADADLLQHGNAVLEFAKEHQKPVMAAEASPTEGIFPGNTEVWDSWFVNFFSVCYEKNIKAISFINANWTAYSFPGVDWKDARLTNNELVSEAWFLETSKERYLQQSPTLYDELGYEN